MFNTNVRATFRQASSRILKQVRPVSTLRPINTTVRWHAQIRRYSDVSKPLTNRDDDQVADAARRKAEVEAYKAEQPSYQLTFTCGKCMERSTHRISKQGYHHGTVLVNCPKCKNKHLISDHLKIFSDRGITLEDIMKEKGHMITKGVLGADGDVEFTPSEDKKTIPD